MKIPLHLVTSRSEDAAELNEILAGTSWELAQEAAQIVLLDHDPDWRESMKRLIHSHRNACVVLLSNVTDQYLWEEVVQQGGFDILTRPFHKEQVLSTLLFAHAHCRTPWPTKTVS
jgi:FixJ family two-component response regulator